MSFECSYADIPLNVPTGEVRTLVDALIPLLDLRDVQAPPRWPGKNLSGLAWNNPTTYPLGRLNQLFWPCGASRWAIGHFLADGEMVQKIKAKVLTPQFAGANLVVRANDLDSDNPDYGLTCKMYCLPPRPLAGLILDTTQTGTGADLYLLTLVDIRYYWQWVTVSNDGGTTDSPEDWTSLFTALQGVLAVTLNPGTIDTVYQKIEPDSALFANEENAALLLDAALANTGRVLAAKYDGTFTVQKIVDARTAAKTTRDTYKDKRHSGGPVLGLDSAVTDTWRKTVLPSAVQVTFPIWVDNQGYYAPTSQYRCWNLNSYNAIYTSTVDLTSLTNYSQFVGTSLTWTKTFHDTAKARFADSTMAPGGTPDNAATLDALAQQIAKDYVDDLISRLDEVYPGIVPWTPDGCNDLLFLHQADRCLTRVQGKPFNAGVSELQHGLGPLKCVAATSGIEVVRIDYFFVKDTDPPVTPPISPLCFYPGTVMAQTKLGWVPTSKKVWVVFWYTYGYVPELTGAPGVPKTVVLCDGTAAHFAEPMGYDYAPQNNGTPAHPNNGESRPVYGSTEYAAGVVTRCNPVTGLPELDLGG